MKNNVKDDSKCWKLWKRRKDLISRKVDNMDEKEKQNKFYLW